MHPLCQCEHCDDGRKRVTLATVVDHKVPHRGNQALFWDETNWQAMAKACHDAKTQRESPGGGQIQLLHFQNVVWQYNAQAAGELGLNGMNLTFEGGEMAI
jgi:hypothetical protein